MWRHPHSVAPFPTWAIVTSLSDTSTPSRQLLSLPIVQILFPVTFGYSLSSEAVVMRELRRWKKLWRRSWIRSHIRTSMGPSRSCWNGTTSALQPEEITSKGTWVSWMYYQYEKSLETYLMILVKSLLRLDVVKGRQFLLSTWRKMDLNLKKVNDTSSNMICWCNV